MPRFKLTIEYDGRPFIGWQAQQNGRSVQAELERALTAFAGHSVNITGAGRTDAGVHASGQVAHADIEKPMSGFQVMQAANHHLGHAPIAVVDAKPVADTFHARFDARQRWYRYRIINRRARLALDMGLAWHVSQMLDADMMDKAAQHLAGKHDFTTFRHAHCQAKNPVKTLDLICVERAAAEIYVHVAARSFLHHQVRSMVGCLVWVGLGKWTAADLKRALQAADRSCLAFNAPPDGLTFVRVVY